MSITLTGAAVAVVYAAAYRAWGQAAAAAAGMLVATSPNVAAMALEIRAYALFLLMSAATFACLLRYLETPADPRGRVRWLVGMVAFGLLAAYSHFFGLVALGAALTAAFAVALIRRERVGPVLVAGVVSGLLSLGLAPFVLASVGISTPAAPVSLTTKLGGLVKLVYRQFAHPATLNSRLAVGLAVAAFAAGLACAAARRRRSGWEALGMGLVLASGLAVVTLAYMAQSSFSAAAPHYNSWMIPALALFIGGSLEAASPAIRKVALGSILAAVAVNLYGVGQLAVNGNWYAHTAYQPIDALIRLNGVDKVAVIHDNEPDYLEGTPIHHAILGYYREYSTVLDEPGASPRVAPNFPENRTRIAIDDIPSDFLIVVRNRSFSAAEIAEGLRDGAKPIGDGPLVRALLRSDRWERIQESTHYAFFGVDIDVFQRRPQPPQPANLPQLAKP